MNRGYVKLWRKSMDSGFLGNAEAWQLLCWCLLKASHKPYKTLVGKQLVELGPGQLVFGRAAAARELNSTERKIRTCLELLKKADFLTVRATSKFSIITITNWQVYQEERPANDQPGDRQNGRPPTGWRPTSDHKQEHSEHSTEEDPALGAAGADSAPFYLTRRKRKLTGKRLESFEQFWTAFAHARGKAEAADAWLDIPQLTNALMRKIIAAAEREAAARPGLIAAGHAPKWAQGWIAGRRWEDEPPPPDGYCGKSPEQKELEKKRNEEMLLRIVENSRRQNQEIMREKAGRKL